MKAVSQRGVIAGAVLIAVSLYPLGLMVREWWAARQLQAEYQFEPEYEKFSANIEQHHVTVSDDYSKGSFKPEDRRIGQAAIKIDGVDHSDVGQIEIRPYYRDANRYHGWVVVGRLRDRKKGEEWVAVGQRTMGDTLLSGRNASASPNEFRILLVDRNGSIREERFSLQQRASPIYRAIFVRFLYPQAMGFYSQILQGWPTLLYPILYPLVTSVLGALLIALGLIRRNCDV